MLCITQYYDLVRRSLGSSAVGLLEIPQAVSSKEKLFSLVSPAAAVHVTLSASLVR